MPEETSSNSLNKPLSKWTQNKVGVFWIKNKQDGKSYLSGTVEINGEKIPDHIYKNDYQQGNTPHFQAFAVEPPKKN